MGVQKSFGPQSWLFPMPVLVVGTYGENDVPDAMTAAWGGIHDTNQIGLCLSAEHQTVKNLTKRLERGEDAFFSVSPAVEGTAAAADYVGMVSASDLPAGEKIRRSGLHPVRCGGIQAPRFEEFPVVLECRLVSYSPETGALVGDILNVSADESVLDGSGNPDFGKIKPLVFDPAGDAYYKTGPKEDDAFSHPEA